MADTPPNPNPNPPEPPIKTAEPPKTPDLVSDNHAKAIRTLEEKLSTSEKTTQDLRTELNGLREIVKKAGEVKTPIVPEKPMTVLQFIEELVFPPKK